MSVPKKIRCKFSVSEVTEMAWSKTARRVRLAAVYTNSPSASPEDLAFTQATPSGELIATIDNPSALELLRPGATFYLDLVPVEEEKEEEKAS